MICKKCYSKDLSIVKSGPHNKLICNDCLTFQKFLSKEDAEKFLKNKNEKIFITANEKLFDRFKILGHKIADASAIVQNDMIIPKDELNHFKKSLNSMIEELINLQDEIYRL